MLPAIVPACVMTAFVAVEPALSNQLGPRPAARTLGGVCSRPFHPKPMRKAGRELELKALGAFDENPLLRRRRRAEEVGAVFPVALS